MRIFKEPNTEGGFVCPICNTGDVEPVTLVGVAGTEEGNNMQAMQVHIKCLQLVIATEKGTNKKVIFHAGEVN